MKLGADSDTPSRTWLLRGKKISNCKESDAGGTKPRQAKLLANIELSGKAHPRTSMEASSTVLDIKKKGEPGLERLWIKGATSN